jgi:hypothetical protein
MDGSAQFIRMKSCGCCGESKPLDEYHYKRASKDLRQPWCKVCNRARNTAALSKERQKKWLAALSPPELLEAQKRARARAKLKRSITSGETVRKPCEVCGDPRSHGHHDNYDMPLQVRWLCAYHHGEVHRNEKRGMTQ